MTWTIEIGHNFETAHRLAAPGSPDKCQSIHGHSWWVTVTIAGERLDPLDMVVEFGAFKTAWRKWLDTTIDHALVIQKDDPVGDAILAVIPGQRLYRIDANPSTEALAALLHREASRVLGTLSVAVPVRVSRVHLRETRVNAATFEQ